jgi:exodeoxyribonuclease VII large subunit
MPSPIESPVSVASLTETIKFLLEDNDLLRQVWVIGEVSSINPHRSGLFFGLQDPQSKALINCVVWSSQLLRLSTEPHRGEQVIVLGSVKLYPGQGRYQLTVWQCLPAGEGLRALRYRQLRDRLSAAGLFDPERKRALPRHPQTVAVVTSANGAAWGDIQRSLGRRYPGLRVLLSPALVQGEQAAAAIVRAIAAVQRDGRAEVLILARGGGATEDLTCFDTEEVVRAIADCPMPVITGIGHERDESLADLAADVCAHTPTAAAELAVPRWVDLYQEHGIRLQVLRQLVTQQLQAQQTGLEELRSRLNRARPDQRLAQEQQRLRWLQRQLIQVVRSRLGQVQNHQELLREKLISLDPTAVLQRGYAVIRAEGQIVRTSQTVHLGQTVQIQLGQGQLTAQITQIAAGSAPRSPD